MSIEIVCNKCGKRMRAPDNAVGKKAVCQCGNRIVVAVDTTQKTMLSPSPSTSAPTETYAQTNSYPETDDFTGKIVGGYRVLRKLGQGGMGAVWMAHDDNLKRDVALKTLTSDTFSSESAYQRFLQEAQSAAKIFSQHTVTVLAAGRDAHIPYMVMEFVEGESVGNMLDRQKKIPVHTALDYARQAARGLADAQEHGVIHRDIKPDNLMISRKGVVKIADFGLARAATKDNERLTTTGQILGTPVYMSPEQAEGRDVDFRSDIYSLGATLYHMLSGERPFKGESSLRVLMNVVEKNPADLALFVPNISPLTKNIVTKMMAKNPDARFQSYEELIQGIDAAFADSSATHSAKIIAAPQQKSINANSDKTESIWEDEQIVRPDRTENIPASPPAKKKLSLTLAVGIFILLNIGIALVLTVGRENKNDASNATSQNTNAPDSPLTDKSTTQSTTVAPDKTAKSIPAPRFSEKWTPSEEQIEAAQKLGIPVEYEEDLGNGVKLKMVLIPPGNFQMGFEPKSKCRQNDQAPQHVVAINSPYYLCNYELTEQQRDTIMGGTVNPSDQKNGLPVSNYSWAECKIIIRKMNDKFGEGVYRLPSESEWEYACRGGNNISEREGDWPDMVAWYDQNSSGEIHSGGKKWPNNWGLFDMLGNVYEFCEDDYHSNYTNAPSDQQPWMDRPRGELRVLRGGSWLDNQTTCRAAFRGKEQPGVRRQQYGLRLARNIDNVSSPATKTAPIPGKFVRKRLMERRRLAIVIPGPDSDVKAPTTENTEAVRLINKLQTTEAEHYVRNNSRRIYGGKELLEVIQQIDDILIKINSGDVEPLDEAVDAINVLDSESGKQYDEAVKALRQEVAETRNKLKQ